MANDTEQPRTTALHHVHRASGATFTDFGGWQMPVRYGSDLDEHAAVRTAAGLFDLSHMGEITLVGPEAGVALDRALAGALSTKAVGRATYTLLLNEAGGIVDDLIVYRTGPERFLVVANAGNQRIVAEQLARRCAGFDVDVRDVGAATALLAVQGPAAARVIERTAGIAFAPSDERHGRVAPQGAAPHDGSDGVAAAIAALGYYRCAAASFDGEPMLVARTGYTGEDGFELFVDVSLAEPLWAALVAAGAEFGLRPCGLAARDTLRLEAGMPLYGNELGTHTQPAQVGLSRVATRVDGVAYVGAEAVERGVQPDAPVLVGLRLDGRRAGRPGYPVLLDGNVVGAVTSGALSPSLGHPIAFALIARDAAERTSGLTVDVRGSAVSATITDIPFYRREKSTR